MEESALLIAILSQFGNEIVDAYRRQLYENDANATGRLGNSLSYRVDIDDGVYDVVLDIEAYWRYLEYGRLPGRFPNIDAIRQWINVKPVVPTLRPGETKLPSVDTLTYLISRKIAKEGIQPRYFLNNVIDNIDLTPLEEGVTRIVENEIDEELRQV